MWMNLYIFCVCHHIYFGSNLFFIQVLLTTTNKGTRLRFLFSLSCIRARKFHFCKNSPDVISIRTVSAILLAIVRALPLTEYAPFVDVIDLRNNSLQLTFLIFLKMKE